MITIIVGTITVILLIVLAMTPTILNKRIKTKQSLSRTRARNTRVYGTEMGEKEKMDESLKSLASCAEKLGTSFDSFSAAAETLASFSSDDRESPPDDILLAGLKRKWDESDYAHAKRLWDMSDKRTKFTARTKYHISFSDSSEKDEWVIAEETVSAVGPSGDTVLSWDCSPRTLTGYTTREVYKDRDSLTFTLDSPVTLSSTTYTTRGVYYDPYTNTVYTDAVKADTANTVNTANTATTTLNTASVAYTPEVISAELVSKVGSFITTSNTTLNTTGG